METNKIHLHDVTKPWKMLADKSVHCIVTSPPYWNLRDYGVKGQLGLEDTPEQFIRNMVKVFREAWRVLRDDGCMWVNIGDSYATSNMSRHNGTRAGRDQSAMTGRRRSAAKGLKSKDLVGIPWRLAFALQKDGWYLRQDIIWAKNSVMPESVNDRCTKAHEYIFLLTKKPKYFFDAFAIKEPASYNTHARVARARIGTKCHPDEKKNAIRPRKMQEPGSGNRNNSDFNSYMTGMVEMRNKRSVWTINPQSFPGSHFATFPERLPLDCIKAATSEHGCCAGCGKPYKRILEPSARYSGVLGVGYNDHLETAEKGMMQGRRSNIQNKMRDAGIAGAEYETTGWAKTCKCKDGNEIPHVVPCVVLDPFSGAGTTFLVARKLGRNAVGLELSPKYIAMSIKRLQSELGLFM